MLRLAIETFVCLLICTMLMKFKDNQYLSVLETRSCEIVSQGGVFCNSVMRQHKKEYSDKNSRSCWRAKKSTLQETNYRQVNGLSREYELPVPEEERNLDEEMLTPPVGDNPGSLSHILHSGTHSIQQCKTADICACAECMNDSLRSSFSRRRKQGKETSHVHGTNQIKSNQCIVQSQNESKRDQGFRA